jgi:nucleoside-diphosphate-sugar epimerase
MLRQHPSGNRVERSMSDLVLVTGISGFLGGHVALQLLNAGYRVRGSVRSLNRADKVKATLAANGADTSNLEFIALDLMADAGWAEAMEGVRYLQHVASPFVVELPRDRDELVRPAVEGTRRAVARALAADVERVVLTSSIAAIVYGHTDYSRRLTTGDWTNVDNPSVNAYPESKYRAEQAAWAIAESYGAMDRLAVINPAAILGPLLDDDPGTSAALVSRLLDGSIPAAPRISFSLVDVRDVAEAQVKAMTAPGAGGRRHILSDRELSILALANELRPHLPPHIAHRLPGVEAPDWLVRTIALFDRQIRGNIDELGKVRAVDGSSGEALLGHKLIPAIDAARATAQSLIDHGLVK